MGRPTAGTLCRVSEGCGEVGPDDPPGLEVVEVNKKGGAQLTTMKQVRASVVGQREQWRFAMHTEVDSLRENCTYEVASADEIRSLTPRIIPR